MNKKEAIAYAQIALDYMQSSKYTGEINIETIALEMKQAFKMYPRNLVLTIAEAKVSSRRTLLTFKDSSDTYE